MMRGEVWWADVPPPVRARPVVILTRDEVLRNIGAVTVALVTRTVRGIPTEVQLGSREGLPSKSVVNFDNLLTIPRALLKYQMGALGREKREAMDHALKITLGLS